MGEEKLKKFFLKYWEMTPSIEQCYIFMAKAEDEQGALTFFNAILKNNSLSQNNINTKNSTVNIKIIEKIDLSRLPFINPLKTTEKNKTETKKNIKKKINEMDKKNEKGVCQLFFDLEVLKVI